MDQNTDTKWMNINEYRVSYDEVNGYIAYNSDGKVVYQINKDGIALIQTQNGNSIAISGLKPSDFTANKIFIDDEGCEHYFSGEAITSTKIYSDNGNIFREITYNNDTKIIKEYDENGDKIIREITRNNDYSEVIKDNVSGITEYWSPFQNNYCREYPDGSKEYVLEDEEKFIIYPNGTYSKGDKKGTYVIDENGNIICDVNDGSRIFYNKLGQKYQEITPSGSVYNYDINQQKTVINGKTTYSMIDHIEYDEEAYNKVLTTLNGIDENGVISGCSGVEGAIASFPDNYSSSGINNVKTDIEGHVNLIKSLSEMTNYSLLAYQTCDDGLRDGLYLLVDSLFGDNELTLANRFKYDIKRCIEDRDNDGILEYKEGTDFRLLSENAIVADIYTDSDGNKWYLNRINHVIGIEGNNIKLNYGGSLYGDVFNVVYDENGIIRLIDSSGNPLNIFGDYNLESEQFGGDQGDFMNCFGDNLNYYAKNILEKYFPDANSEELQAVFEDIAMSGCGNVAIANLVFKKFEGNEEGFYNTFGYPMYDIVKTKDGLSVDYNYEPLITDLYCHERKNGTIQDYFRTDWQKIGTLSHNVTSMTEYLKDEYNVLLSGYDETYEYYGETGYYLYNMDGSLFEPTRGTGHAMIGIGRTADGRIIVSSWGRKFILERSTVLADIEYNQEEYREFH